MRATIVNRQRGRRVSERSLAEFLERVAAAYGPEAIEADEVSVLLVSDRRMSQLNRAWRGRSGTTDVLSFPAGPPDPGAAERSLGDIVISVPRAALQARAAGHSLAREMRVLALHGLLHLLGHDHETDDGTMMRLQARLLRAVDRRAGRAS